MQPADSPPAIVVDAPVDGAITMGGGAAWLLSEALAPEIGPHACRWCIPPAFDARVRAALVWSSPGRAAVLSDIAAFALAPVVAFGGDAIASAHENARQLWLGDALVLSESAVLALDANQLTKFVVARERPSSYFANAAPSVGDHLSFYSGHTTLAFTLATASGTLATLHEWRYAPIVWLVGLTVASATGYLRIAADAHYLSDVVVGALAGGAFGVGVPLLHTRGSGSARLTSLRTEGGFGLALSGTW